MSMVFDDEAHSLTVRGTGTDNAEPVTFAMVAVGNVATKRDTFSLVLSDGYRNTATRGPCSRWDDPLALVGQLST